MKIMRKSLLYCTVMAILPCTLKENYCTNLIFLICKLQTMITSLCLLSNKFSNCLLFFIIWNYTVLYSVDYEAIICENTLIKDYIHVKVIDNFIKIHIDFSPK